MSVKNLLAMLTAVLIFGCGNAFAVTPYATTPPAGTSLLSAVTPAQGTAFLNATSVNTITVTAGGTGYQYQQIAYPSGDGTSSGSWTVFPASPTTKWDKVDDPAAVPDDASTYIDSASASGHFLWTFPAFSVPINATITEITLFYRVKSSTTAQQVCSGIGNTAPGYGFYEFPGQGPITYHSDTTSYSTFSDAWTTNPITGLAWTPADVNNASSSAIQQFGVYFSSSGVTNYITQVYAVVTYGVPPVVTITPADGNGSGATASPVMVDSNGNPTDAIQSVTVTTHGSAYTTPPQISFSGGNQDATATAALYASTIGGVTVTDPGSGYATTPFVAFNGGGGTLATATATIDATGAVDSVTVTSGGSGFTAVPTVSFIELTGNYIGTQYLTSGTTFTPDAGTNTIRFEMVGGGGGGGYNLGSGGGAGGYLEKLIRGFSGTASYAIGASGIGSVNGTPGTNGGNTTFTYNGVTYTAYGGNLGANNSIADTAGAGISLNGDLKIGGGDGGIFGASGAGGMGGASFFGGGAGKGNSAVVPGAGGGGGPTTTSGGAGGAGLIIVDEYGSLNSGGGGSGGGGATGATGPAGADGNTILYGSGAPSSGTGVDGNFYIDTVANYLYGPKASGSWPAGTSLVGPTGATGAAGATGATGPAPSGTGIVIVTGGTPSAVTALPNGTTGTTQAANDNSTQIATTAYADGGRALVLVASQTVAGSAVASVTFSSLSITADGEYELHYEILNAIGTTPAIYAYLNGDTTAANYTSYSVSSAAVPTLNAIAAYGCTGVTKFLLYNSRLIWNGTGNTWASGTPRPSNYCGMWNTSASNLTSIQIACSTGTSIIGVGSRFSLYKVKR